MRMFAGPIAFPRVAVGVSLVVMGVVWANAILEFVLEASSGTLSISSHLQAQLVSWEISALAALFGAGFAGATTFNGLKQGLCVGLGAGVLILGIRIGTAETPVEPEPLILMISSVFLLTLAGGWFGGQLFPPLAVRQRLSTF
jgi:hypothetical protein